MTRKLEDVQDEIVTRLHAGEDVDREAILAENPEHEEALVAFFELLDVIEGAPAEEEAAPTRLGEFRIERELGRGGMGVVYVAEQVSLKRRVALKVLPPSLRADVRLLARFQREAEAAGRLRHPGIVPVFSVGAAAGTPFFAMELVEGRSLESVIRALRAGEETDVPPAGPGRVRWAVETIARVADALAYAHGRGILHRDVKPGNIILEADGTPRLTDFGLALDLHAPGLTVAGEVFGSPQYMSPEQAVRREAPVDERTDVYSLAVTLYELLTLRLPYDAGTSAELLTALAAGKVIPVRKADPTVPGPVAGVLMRALEKDPRDRYAGAAELAADLRASLEARASLTCAARPRRRRLVAAAAVLALVLAGAAALFWPSGGGTLALPGVYIPSDQVAALADGGDARGREILGESLEPEVRVRRVLSRHDLGAYQCIVRWGIVDTGWEDVSFVVAAYWEASVNRGPFRPIGSGFMGLTRSASPPPSGTQVASYSVMTSPLLATVLGDSAGEPSVSIRHRVTVRIANRPAGWVDPEATPLEGGTSWTWTGPDRDFLLYDEYPEDYPERVSDPAIDEAMRAAITPDHLTYAGVTVDGGRRYLQLRLNHTGPDGPIPAAFEVEVRRPRDGRLIGTTTLSRDEATPDETEGDVRVEHVQVIGMPLLLPERANPEEAETLLALEAGKVEELRVVFRPSRRVALDQPHFDRYWGGVLDVTVPVRRIGESGLEDLVR